MLELKVVVALSEVRKLMQHYLSAVSKNVKLNLSKKHQQTWDVPRLRLWARCIVSGVHNDSDNTPNIPTFSETTPKTARKESFK